MFLDAAGQPHAAEHYERIARQVVPRADSGDDPARSFRRLALESDTTWARVREMGSALDHALPGHIRDDAVRLAAGPRRRGHHRVVGEGDEQGGQPSWWRCGRSSGSATRETLAADPAFAKARNKLSEALGSVVATTRGALRRSVGCPRHGRGGRRDWAGSRARSSRRGLRSATEAGAPPWQRPPPPVSRGARSTRASGAAAAVRDEPADADERDWTAEERDVFARHVVNLRNGKLSTDGSFSSTSEQVERIFDELIPAYAAAQKAKGSTPRVMFYAHGGLVEEREGLLRGAGAPAILGAERRLPGLLRLGDRPAGDAAGTSSAWPRCRRGRHGAALTDAAIETLARQRRQAGLGPDEEERREAPSDTDGGARLVAELAGEAVEERSRWKSSSTRSATAPARSSTRYFLPLLVAQRPAGVPPVERPHACTSSRRRSRPICSRSA